ncbi:MAG: hypothetical protein J4F31_08405 [Flavobacteriales bacterium]|nr:hypothetical protein [Flavobacteriales bacterium]
MDDRRARLDTLRLNIDSLSELTDRVLLNDQFSGTLEGLKLRWTELDGKLTPLVTELSARNKQLEKVELNLKLYRDSWSQLLALVESGESKKDLAERIGVTIFRINSVFEVADDSFEETLEVESLATELVLRIQSNKSRIEEAKSRELISRITERTRPIFSRGNDTLDAPAIEFKKLLWLARSDARLYL